ELLFGRLLRRRLRLETNWLQFLGQIEQPRCLVVPQAKLLPHAPAFEQHPMNGQGNSERDNEGIPRRQISDISRFRPVPVHAGKECRLRRLSAMVITGSERNFSTKRARGNRVGGSMDHPTPWKSLR